MYCPKCSQQQLSEDIRFCPRCGLQLNAVKMLLADNQNILETPDTETQSQVAPTRKRDMLLGATVMLVAAIVIALIAISSVSGTPWQAVVIPLLLVWLAIVFVLLLSGHAVREVKKLFSKDTAGSESPASSSLITQVSASARHQALPPMQGAPVSGFSSWRVNTAELAQPPSVTEHTTNLLDKK